MTETVSEHEQEVYMASESFHSTLNERSPILSTPPVSSHNEHRLTKKKLLVVGSILITELCERMTFYSVMANMILFCTSTLKYTSQGASMVYLIFGGTVSIFPVIGGYVSDAFAGKYKTILGSGLIYLFGLILLPASAVDYPKWFHSEHDITIKAREILFFLGLVLIAIGTGGIKANVGPFGAQQVDELGAKMVQSFFNWFYWFINAGSVIAFSAVAYVQQEKGFDVGFLIPLFSMLIAIIIFIVARKTYIHKPPGGSILFKSIRVCCHSCNSCKDPSWTHAVNKGHAEDFVYGVRAATRVLPIFILIIVYWAVYSQMGSSLFLQSERMDLYVGSAKMPAALLNVFDTIIILILIPIMDTCVYPCLRRFSKSPSHLQRMGIGMVLASCAMLYAGMIEMVRKSDIEKHGGFSQELAGDHFNASNISMFAQVPEFIFIGSSEVFTSISGLEFAYTQAPPYMQGLLMGLFLMTSGIGSYLASAIVGIVRTWRTSDASDWYPKEPNKGHLEYTLFLLAVLTMLNLAVFIIVAKRYKYKSSTDTNEPASSDRDVVIIVTESTESEHGGHYGTLGNSERLSDNGGDLGNECTGGKKENSDNGAVNENTALCDYDTSYENSGNSDKTAQNSVTRRSTGGFNDIDTVAVNDMGHVENEIYH